MKSNLIFVASFAISILIVACKSAKEPTGVWVNTEKAKGKSFAKVMIVMVTADAQARVVIENDLAAAATARKYNVVKSIDVAPPNIKDPKPPSKDEIVKKVKETGCDAVFVASLLKKDEDVRYKQGGTTYSKLPYDSWSGSLTGYYTYWYPSVSTPSYYSHDQTYFMQSNLYDAASEEIMWSAQSKIFNPSSLKSFSKTYTSTLLKQLEKEKLLKK
jgi:hypothetical protein